MVIADLTAQVGRWQEETRQLQEELATERIAGDRARQVEKDTALNLERVLRRNSELEGLAETVQSLRDALRTFLGVDGLAPPDLDTLAEKVAARTRVASVRWVPLEALKHRFQQQAVARLTLQVQALEERPRQAILWLLAVGRPATYKEICSQLGFPEIGGSYTKFRSDMKEAIDIGFLTSDSHGLHVAIRNRVGVELAPYAPAPEDMEATYQHLLAALVNEAGSGE